MRIIWQKYQLSSKMCFFLLLILPFNVYSDTNELGKSKAESYKIKKDKLDIAYQLITDFENELDKGGLHYESVINGIDMKDFVKDLRTMLANPNSSLIGHNGHYCGPAAILNWLINCYPEKYVKAVLELAQSGETRFEKDAPLIKVPKVLKKKIDFSIKDTINNIFIREDIDTTSLSDFIMVLSLVNSEKFIQRIGLLDPKATINKKRIGCLLYTITMPWEMNNYFKKLGIEIESHGYYLGDSEVPEELIRIENAVQEGKMPIIFDNHFISFARTRNFLFKFTGAHFITIHSFQVNNEKGTVDYTYWDYGNVKPNPFLTRKLKPKSTGSLKKDLKEIKKFRKKGLDKKRNEITIDEFLKAMKGYWIPES